MAYFYDKNSPSELMDEPGGFNMDILIEMRKTLIHLDGNLQETKLNENIMDFISTSVIFDFPDDEIG